MIGHFEGAGGALTVSMIAFTIVFVVLAGLTLVIFAIKFFAGSPENKGSGTSGTPVVPSVTPVVSTPAAPVQPAGKSRVAAAITAAILAATQGRGRVLSVTPLGVSTGSVAPSARTTWKTTGIVERISGRLSRPWKH